MRIWCGHCKTMVKTCQSKPLSECSHIEKLQYRFVGFIPGTKKRIVRSLGTDFSEAVKQVATLRQKLDAGEIEERLPKRQTTIAEAPVPHTGAKPELLVHTFGKYLATLKGEGVAPHLRLIRSKSHISDVKSCFKNFVLALHAARIDTTQFKLNEINDNVVGKFHDYLIEKGYSDSVYNRWFSTLTTFASYAESEEYGNVKRFFERVPRKTITPRPEVITKEEFQKVLSVITYENGFQKGIGKHERTRNHFRPYLITAFRFALTGRRLEELIMARFSDVHCDPNGKPLLIEFTDFKVSRILHTAEGKERKLHSPVTNQISRFLYEQGLQEKRNSNEFIIAPEITSNRVPTVKSALSRGFSHFWKVAHPDKPLKTFKVLRKVVMTALKIRMGADIRPISGHSGEQVLRNYIDEKQVALASSLEDFTVFGDGEEEIIQSKKQQKKKLTIER